VRRWLLTVLVAAAVMPLAAAALAGVWAAIVAPSMSAGVEAAGDVVRAAVALGLAIVVLSLGDDPPVRPLALVDWRALLPWHALSDGGRGADRSG
jgi:hypothetical protein